MRHTKNPYLFHETAIRVLSVLIFRTLPRPCFGFGELIPGMVVTLALIVGSEAEDKQEKEDMKISETYKEQTLVLSS